MRVLSFEDQIETVNLLFEQYCVCLPGDRQVRSWECFGQSRGIDRSDLGNAMADCEVWSTVVACIPTSKS